ncbi:FAD/NAD(P)-binding domain-containing protein [Laetiporus sulphureus 93-53]|uniref:FAD/NAD(P)-binding domain-containing protein n=1 Tax=Laetiporus sulphureus 93-53 TaxID=1314785 RepID=A0A165BZE5_9APHY|nr:FAD/NAD(P)-binding domain-containing protein [Laetiporus sulphureus 93-53]KZT01928.1 FAD/NAD(P)-binding domain-containing protein [Laetiporus sulphureus 93-53]
MQNERFRIAIVGSGIGGLTFALSLHELCQDIRVDIYESTASFTEIGAGIGLWPRPWEIMQALGLESDLLSISDTSGSLERWVQFIYRKSDQAEGVTFCEGRQRVRFKPLHRADFQAILSKRLPDSWDVHFSKRLSSYDVTRTGEISLRFTDASTATCDLLVGCDGLKSAVRMGLYSTLSQQAQAAGDDVGAARLRSMSTPMWTGSVAYRGLVPRTALEEVDPTHPALTDALMYFGKDKHLLTFPVSQGRVINVVAFFSQPELEGTAYDGPWVRQVTKDELLADFASWESQVRSLLGCLDKVSLWAIHSLPSLPTYVGNRVALLGDAAHAMTPHQGSGAGQAAEDAFVLANIIAHPAVTMETLPDALRVYDEIRRPFSQEIVERSRQTGLIYDLVSPALPHITEEASASGEIPSEILEEAGRMVVDLTSWLGSTSIMDDRDKALAMLNALLNTEH